MATATTKPAEVRALSRERLAKRLRRITLVVGVSLGIWAYLCWGARWVPIGMDTVPAIPPGSFCVVDKRASTVKIGSHVFIELPGVGVVLSRVTARNGDRIRIESAHGEIETEAKLTDEVVAGTIAVPHGWGHRGGWETANRAGGANVNLLMSSRPEDLERLAGMAHLNGVAVRIEAAPRPVASL